LSWNGFSWYNKNCAKIPYHFEQNKLLAPFSPFFVNFGKFYMWLNTSVFTIIKEKHMEILNFLQFQALSLIMNIHCLAQIFRMFPIAKSSRLSNLNIFAMKKCWRFQPSKLFCWLIWYIKLWRISNLHNEMVFFDYAFFFV
jgi:hypothetical protein